MKVKKSKKYADGGPLQAKPKKAPVKMVESEMTPGKMIPESDIRRGAYITIDSKKKAAKPVPKKKMKDGGKSFPDLNKDRKITKADILKGRGVIAKRGVKVAKKMMGGGKCKYGC